MKKLLVTLLCMGSLSLLPSCCGRCKKKQKTPKNQRQEQMIETTRTMETETTSRQAPVKF